MDETEFLRQALAAIDRRDYDALEALRDAVHPSFVAALAETWSSVLSWDRKDCYIALLMDQSGESVTQLMRDGLDSPTVESRAYALCALTADHNLFSQLLDGGWVSEAKVDAAIKEFRRNDH